MNPGTPTVFVVDDDASYLRSITRLLRASGFTVAGFPSAEAFLADLHADAAGCVVTDLRMPSISGLQLQQALNQSDNPLPVIFLSGQGDIPTTVQAMRGGAEDFLTKTAPKEALLNSIRNALECDQRWRAERSRRTTARELLQTLTAREREVLKHLLQGKPNKQIAADLAIHERTVKLHRTSLTRKLGVHSVVELARLVQQASLS